MQGIFTKRSKADYPGGHCFKNCDIGQAPGQKVQDSGIPWEYASGNNLRQWLGVDKQTFYNEKVFALIPMGFCFPGGGKSGDLPPRPKHICQTICHYRTHRRVTTFGKRKTSGLRKAWYQRYRKK